ncbi:MAG: class I SAM-dependent methyltransferase, partial [Bacteroidetes bacterium]|nr:class I SAM-dependent methyltransferase [Bacteroidota bacterium]
MFDFHKEKERYFKYQYLTSKEYIIPFINSEVDVKRELKVLEIGCAEAGVLKAFTEIGHKCTGIELRADRVELARKFMEEEIADNKIDFLVKDIYDVDVEHDLPHRYDLVILKDVIEHIPGQERFIKELDKFLAPNGKVFFGFPPWYMPFGGHQQICDSKFLSFLPYFHLLPMPVYTMILKMFGESRERIQGLKEIKETGISIERFQRIIKKEGFRTENFLFRITAVGETNIGNSFLSMGTRGLRETGITATTSVSGSAVVDEGNTTVADGGAG